MTDHYKSRASTHADGCWDWGPKHYECAVGKIERDEALQYLGFANIVTVTWSPEEIEY